MANMYKRENLIRGLSEARENISEITKLYPDEEKHTDDYKNRIVQIDIDRLEDNPLNPFSPLSGDKWDEFVSSIRAQGILTPLIVRKINGIEPKYQILAGHNRKRAAAECGIRTLPCMIVEADDVEANIIVATTNRQREETNDIEWAKSYRATYEAMKRTGNQYTSGGGQNDHKQNIASESGGGQNDHKQKKTSEILADRYGISEKTFRRKMRLAYLIPQLANMYLKKRITQEQAEILSYLKEQEQLNINSSFASGNYTITTEFAKHMKELSEAKPEGEIVTIDEVCDMAMELQDEARENKPKARYRVDDTLFPKKLTKAQKESYITKALSYIRDNGIEL